MLKKSVINNLRNIVGEGNTILESDSLKAHSLDDVMPKAVVFPSSVEEVSEIMKLATKHSLSVIPTGGGTKSFLGNKPPSADIILSTKNLNQVLEHASSDLVATTQSGISIEDLQSELGKENQFLAIDPPHIQHGASLGGIIASNDSGPLRFRYGTFRELLIGLKVVQADGSIFKGGAKVVKNVAGYDLPKLFVGSLGTLGIIVEATFRLYAVPEYSQTYLANFSSIDDCHNALMMLTSSDLAITSLELINPTLALALSENNSIKYKADNYLLAVRIRNVEQAVKDQISKAKQICSNNNGSGTVLSDEVELGFWDDVINFPWALSNTQRTVSKASVLVSDIPKLLMSLDALSSKNGITPYVSVRAGSGICIISFSAEDSNTIASINSLRSFAAALGGHLVVQEAPISVKSEIDVWGDLGSGRSIMKKIKSNFDPDNILNPGRYI
ncbi:MAG: FAD-binding oxidoreductase [Thermodesulfobacteriota bacterium]